MTTSLMKKLHPYAVEFLLNAGRGASGRLSIKIPASDVRNFFSGVKDQETLRAAITEYFGPRCGEDASSYLLTPEQGICSCCEAWLAFDRFTRSVVYPAAIIEGL